MSGWDCEACHFGIGELCRLSFTTLLWESLTGSLGCACRNLREALGLYWEGTLEVAGGSLLLQGGSAHPCCSCLLLSSALESLMLSKPPFKGILTHFLK